MKVSFLKLRFLLVLIVSAGFLFAHSLPTFAQQTRKSAAKSSVKKSKIKKVVRRSVSKNQADDKTPWEGEVGVSKTMAELIREQSLIPTSTEIEVVRERKRIRPDRRNLPQNEDSPMIEKFPVDPTTKAVQEIAPNIAPQTPQTVGLNFNGGTLSDTLSFPPDTMGEVGPSQYIMAVNGWIRSFNKTTGTADGVMNIDMDVFFNSVRNGSSTSDPRIRYDRLSQRWIIAIINVANTDNRILIAVSNTQNITPATVWTYYFFVNSAVAPAGDTGCFADYPTLGVDTNALYIGVNNFCPTNFGGTTGFVVRKSSVLSGGPIVVTPFRGLVASGGAGAGLYTPQGVDNFDPAATAGYFIAVDNATFGLLKLRRVSNPGGTPTISGDINLAVPATAFAPTVPHLGNTLGTNGNLDSLDDRLFMAHLRNGRIYTSHNIGVNSSGVATGVDRAGSRWYEIDNVATTPTLRQSGTWFDTAVTTPKSLWIPSIMVSGQGHIALGGSSAGLNDRINAATIGRLSSDPLGTLQTTATITASTTAYNPTSDPGPTRRFGDYSYTTIDPEDDMTMWTIQQWNQATNSYAMRITKLVAPPPATPASASPATISGGEASVNVTITGTVVNGSGFFEPGPTFAKHIAATVSGGVTVNSVTYTSPTQITLNLSTVGTASGTKNVTVTNPDGQALTGNNLITVNSSPGAGVKIPADFDGDGKTDISTFRNVSGTGTWYTTNSSNGAFVATPFGFGTDLIAPGDYDGDNKTDVAVFRDGAWYLLRSSNGAFQAFNFGQAGDKPTPGDFDGDNKADFAVFRPSNGTWYITRSSDNAFVASAFGTMGDIPVFGRYDSDSKDDIAVFRPSNGTWYITQSTNNAFVGFAFGTSGDIPTAGDYDGDGKFDYAVFRPSNGAWYISQSSNAAFRGQLFGQNGDIPVPGNYDADSKFDFAVFRAGIWYTQGNVSGAFTGFAFGLGTDKPIPSAFVQ